MLLERFSLLNLWEWVVPKSIYKTQVSFPLGSPIAERKRAFNAAFEVGRRYRSARARPIPEVAPVTSTVLPARSILCGEHGMTDADRAEIHWWRQPVRESAAAAQFSPQPQIHPTALNLPNPHRVRPNHPSTHPPTRVPCLRPEIPHVISRGFLRYLLKNIAEKREWCKFIPIISFTQKISMTSGLWGKHKHNPRAWGVC